MKHVLEVDSVQKTLGHKKVLSDVFLKCETGEVIGLLGRNGSGKSTLLKIIFGLVAADEKFIRIDWKTKYKTSELLKEVSYLSQNHFIPKHFTVKKAIALTVEKSRRSTFNTDAFLQGLLDKKIDRLSTGELRYLEIKLVLSSASKFALLDEPYNGLSPLMLEQVNQLITDATQHKGIIITDHNYRNVLKISTRLILMKDGKTYHLKNQQELIERGYLMEGML
ncbi:ATP-binding cassette domain-containing protein [Flavobacterium sp. SM15]|uniref:ATP-binding cassette domain-containing protein n=1 Tax=Flavobacterium sp. SM15 TaxID=2908005 RepID=UPI001EDA435B|nr:ATP-binding cassette domain-containing protein [Flavobacterium sp. SM15]MCG2610227.1 ATP-binding cassette domain-containing protein [Flavobacterium sp. SM15]